MHTATGSGGLGSSPSVDNEMVNVYTTDAHACIRNGHDQSMQ